MEISMLVGRVFYFDKELREHGDPMVHEILQEDRGLIMYSCGGPSMKMSTVGDLIDDGITLFENAEEAVAWIRVKRETAERKAAGKAGMN